MTDRPSPDPERGVLARSAGRVLFALAVAAWLGAAAWFLWPAGPPPGGERSRRAGGPVAAAYAGSRACAECHPGEYALHAGSGHARTLSLAARAHDAPRLDGKSVQDPEDPASLWTFAFRDGRLELERTRDGQVAQQVLGYALGSGRHAVTFVSLTGSDPHRPEGFEHRVSYFAKGGSLGLTPGQYKETHSPGTTALGRHFNADETRKCFECHSTLTSGRGDDELDVRTMIPNVTCERCHGPGRAHVDAARRGVRDRSLAFGPGRWSASEQMALCGACHRLPEFIPPEQRVPGNAILRRFQSVGLALSRCYVQSRGALSCVTCHDPHARAKTDPAAYNAACVRCHQSAPRSVCPSGGSDCVACHMPKRPSGVDLFFADHWIRRHPD